MTAAAFRILLGLTLIVVWSAGPTFAVTLAFDENGNSSVGPGALALDPGPGGAAAALTYQLPFSVVPGDVFFGNEPGLVLGGDVVRFNSPVGAAGSTLVFYSDNIPIADSLGDTSAPPGAFYPNQVTIQEIGLEGTNSATYTPTTGQPGFNANLPLTYLLVSDGSVMPEPSSLVLLGVGLAGFAGAAWRRHRLE